MENYIYINSVYWRKYTINTLWVKFFTAFLYNVFTVEFKIFNKALNYFFVIENSVWIKCLTNIKTYLVK